MADISGLEVTLMASIVVRGLDPDVKAGLVERARQHGRSMEAEARDILTRAVIRPHIGLALLRAGREAGGIEHLPVPERTDRARAVDLP
jgi:plasmid stability protein